MNEWWGHEGKTCETHTHTQVCCKSSSFVATDACFWLLQGNKEMKMFYYNLPYSVLSPFTDTTTHRTWMKKKQTKEVPSENALISVEATTRKQRDHDYCATTTAHKILDKLLIIMKIFSHENFDEVKIPSQCCLKSSREGNLLVIARIDHFECVHIPIPPVCRHSDDNVTKKKFLIRWKL